MFRKFKMVFTPWCTPANVVVSTVIVKFAETCSHFFETEQECRDLFSYFETEQEYKRFPLTDLPSLVGRGARVHPAVSQRDIHNGQLLMIMVMMMMMRALLTIVWSILTILTSHGKGNRVLWKFQNDDIFKSWVPWTRFPPVCGRCGPPPLLVLPSGQQMHDAKSPDQERWWNMFQSTWEVYQLCHPP